MYSASIAFFFIISSIVLAALNSRTPLELSAVVRTFTFISLRCLLLFLILLLNFIFVLLLPQVFGFVASMFFIADVLLFLKTRGSPFSNTKELLSNGMAAAQATPPEKEQLNSPTAEAVWEFSHCVFECRLSWGSFPCHQRGVRCHLWGCSVLQP